MIWPFENDTRSSIKKLAKRSLQSEKRRNGMVVISVALAAFLISFGGMLAVSISQLQNDKIMDTYEALYQNVDEQTITTIKEQPEIARVGEYYSLDQELSMQGYKASIFYADDNMMYIVRQQMEIAEGKLPTKADEIMVSESWLNKFAPKKKIGDTVSLGIDSFKEAYRISGILHTEDATEVESYSFLISKEQLQKHAGYNASKYRAYVHLDHVTNMSSDEIKAYYEILSEESVGSSPSYNAQYFSRISKNVNMDTILIIGFLAVIVLLGGCVVIQSIFRISIIDKIQSYGQLRTLGATKKQIMQIVRMEGRRLGWIGIIIGACLGSCIPVVLVASDVTVADYVLVMFATVSICWIMIRISIRKPVKMAASVSPIEAVHFVSTQRKLSRSKKTHKKLHPIVLAKMNFGRDRKKLISIFVSISTGGILLLCASTLLLTYSPETFARKYFPNGDYKIYVKSDKDLEELYRKGTPLSEDLKKKILSIDGVSNVLTTRRSTGTDFQIKDFSGGGMGDMITEDNYVSIEESLEQGTMPQDEHSIIIVNSYEDIAVGSKAQLSLGGKSTTVTVSGIVDTTTITQGYGHGNIRIDGAMLYLPSSLFEELLPNIDDFTYTWEIISDPAKEATVKVGLQKIINSQHDIALDSYTEQVEHSKLSYSMPFHILQGVALFISLFGIINLINTSLSDQMSRRKEISMLRSVGLTKKQLYQMITFEGIGYVISSVFLTLLIGLPLAYSLHNQMSTITYGTSTAFQFPMLYMMLYFLLLIAIELLLSLWTIRKHSKRSLIEQLRTLE